MKKRSGTLVQTGVWALAALLAGAPSLAAPARKRTPAKAAPRAKASPVKPKGPQGRIRTVTVSPARVLLEGPEAQQTLLVTGVTASGKQVDLTGAAVVRSLAPKVARMLPGAVVGMAGNGSGLVEVRAGGKAVRVPVTARNQGVRRPLNFANDVLPVLQKAGCSGSACHAKQGGKGGFQLSVLAFDPDADFYAVARQADGRRVNRIEPAKSLLLLKATSAVPHGGGQRFKTDSPEYRLLARWIAEGAPQGAPEDASLARIEVEPRERMLAPKTRQRLQVTAVYSDGSRRDVTRLAQLKSNEEGVAETPEGTEIRTTDTSGEAAITVRYMSQVAVARVTVPLAEKVAPSAYAALPRHNFIDEHVYRKLSQLRLLPSELCDDATFLRRASLDLIGTLPTPEEARKFLTECQAESGGKGPALKARAKLVDRLLARPEYADYWAMRWSNLLLINPDLLLPRGAYAFDRWLRDSFRANQPFDQFAREIVTATGETYREGPPNFYRALRKPDEAGKSVSQLFLGIRMDCAQCHHHPFERWGQDDFYGMAAYFARVRDKGSYPEGYHSSIYVAPDGEVKHPKTDQVMAPRPPGADAPPIAEGEDRREVLARWMTAPDNPYFARAIVNRMWGLLLSRGIVEPVDDFRMTNPASNEPLLDALAGVFVKSGFDLKHLLKTITLSATYQRSSAATKNNARDTRNYSRYYTKRMPGEVLLDGISQVTGLPYQFRGHPEGTRAIQMWDSRLDVEFLDIFGRPTRQSVCECERPTDGSVTQALHLMNSTGMQERLASDKGWVAALDKSGKPEDEVIQELYLAAFSRLPRPEELAAAKTAFTREKVTRKQAIEDVLWALMNSAEFILNH